MQHFHHDRLLYICPNICSSGLLRFRILQGLNSCCPPPILPCFIPFYCRETLHWARRAVLINSPLTRVWLAYRFFLPPSLKNCLARLHFCDTAQLHQQPQMRISFDWPAFERNISHCVYVFTMTLAHTIVFSLANITWIWFYCPPTDWSRSHSRWILPVKVSPRLWCQPHPSTGLHHLLPRQRPPSPCRSTTLPTPSAAASAGSWREATP